MASEALLRITDPLRTERLVLRTLTPDDLDDVFAYAGRADDVRFDSVLAEDGDSVILGVELPGAEGAGGRIIGDITLVLTSAPNRQASIGWTLNPEFRGRGFATEAAARVLTLAFDELGAHRVIAELDPRNDDSAALCYRLGMRHEGHFVHCRIVEGEWSDRATYAILDVEWNARNALDG